MEMIFKLILVVLSQLLVPHRVEAAQKIIREPSDLTANLGDDVVFPCLVKDLAGILQWTRNGFALGPNPGPPVYPRYSLTPDKSLKISGVTEADAGEYECQVSAGGDNNPPLRSRTAVLNVQVPPGPPTILATNMDSQEGNFVTLTEGETAVLECESFGGKPAASLFWRNADDDTNPAMALNNVKTMTVKRGPEEVTSGQPSIKTVSVLTFVAAKEHHNRSLVCAATNVASKEPSVAHVRLNVSYRPAVRLGISSGTKQLMENTNLVLHCQADANPRPSGYAWYQDGVPLDGETSEFLHVGAVTRQMHNSVIACTATNTVGSAPNRAVTTLSVQYGPRIVSQPGRLIVGRRGDRLELACQADSNPPARYIWTKDNEHQAIGYSSTLELVVSETTQGKYVCQALVEGFEPAKSVPTRVALLSQPQIIKGSGSTDVQKAAVGSDAQLVCSVKSLSRELNITWDYKGRIISDKGSNKYQLIMTNPTDGSDLYHSKLYIRNTSQTDLGQYGCRADNELGSDYMFIRLEESTDDATFLGSLTSNGSWVYILAGAMAALLLMLVIVGIVGVVVCRRRHRLRRDNDASDRGGKLEAGQHLLGKDDTMQARLNNATVAGMAKNAKNEMLNNSSSGNEIALRLTPDLVNDMKEREMMLIMNAARLGNASVIADRQVPIMGPLDGASAFRRFSRTDAPLDHIPVSYAGTYGNPHLAMQQLQQLSDNEFGLASSRSSSHSTLSPAGALGLLDRRSLSPGQFNSDAAEYSTSSTMSSVLSRSNRSHAGVSSGEDSPRLDRGQLPHSTPIRYKVATQQAELGPRPAFSRHTDDDEEDELPPKETEPLTGPVDRRRTSPSTHWQKPGGGAHKARRERRAARGGNRMSRLCEEGGDDTVDTTDDDANSFFSD